MVELAVVMAQVADGEEVLMANLRELASKLAELFRNTSPQRLVSPLPVMAQATPTPAPNVEEKIRKGFQAYGGGKPLPIEHHIPQFVEATEKYPIFKQNPYLLPQIAILESSGGRNVTRENNPLNWGARIQKQGLYQPKSWEQSIQDAITAIAGDIQARPPSQPTRHRQIAYYEPFRRSGDLRDFANIYEPDNPDYYRNLMEGIKLFENQ